MDCLVLHTKISTYGEFKVCREYLCECNIEIGIITLCPGIVIDLLGPDFSATFVPGSAVQTGESVERRKKIQLEKRYAYINPINKHVHAELIEKAHVRAFILRYMQAIHYKSLSY